MFFRNIILAWNETCPYIDYVVSCVDCCQRNGLIAYFLNKETSLKCHYRHIIFQWRNWDSSVREMMGCRLHGCLSFMAVILEFFSPSLFGMAIGTSCLLKRTNQRSTLRGKAVAAWHWSFACMQYECPEILRSSQHCIEHSTVLGCGAVCVGDKMPE